MSDVFISYKAEDRRRVQPLVQALQADGLSVWWDEHIGTGDAWRETIERQLDEALCVIVVWSRRSVGSEGRFVREEASRAQRRNVYVPVLIDAVDPPLGFGESQATSLKGWTGDHRDPRYEAVLHAVERITGSKARNRSAVPAAPARAPVGRRAVVGGGAAAAVALAGGGAWFLLRPSSASASGTIAVLPFDNLSGDSAQAYFSDGIAEEIRSALARIAGLKVVGSTSSEAVRNEDAQTAAKKLGVANILTGSVRQSPSTIRVNAELIDGSTGLDKWSQDYDRKPGDAIKIQTDIAENVAKALSVALGADTRSIISAGGTENPDAQQLVIEAASIGKTRRDEKSAMDRALQLADKAIALDPNYADAYAVKSLLTTVYGNGFSTSYDELAKSRAESLRLAQIAVRIAPNLPRAHVALASLYGSNLEFAAANREQKRALQLAPGDAEILAGYAGRIGAVPGKTDDALRAIDRAIAADPLNPVPYNNKVTILYYGRRYREAVDFARDLDSRSLLDGSLDLADSLMMLGRFDEARQAFAKAPPNYWWRLTGEAVLAIRSGNLAEANAKLAALERANGEAASYQYGEIYAQMGDKDKAFEALDHAYAIKDGGLVQLQADPLLDPLRSDPRFAAFLAKMNFSPV